jgi:hypothetical protein
MNVNQSGSRTCRVIHRGPNLLDEWQDRQQLFCTVVTQDAQVVSAVKIPACAIDSDRRTRSCRWTRAETGSGTRMAMRASSRSSIGWSPRPGATPCSMPTPRCQHHDAVRRGGVRHPDTGATSFSTMYWRSWLDRSLAWIVNSTIGKH